MSVPGAIMLAISSSAMSSSNSSITSSAPSSAAYLKKSWTSSASAICSAMSSLMFSNSSMSKLYLFASTACFPAFIASNTSLSNFEFSIICFYFSRMMLCPSSLTSSASTILALRSIKAPPFLSPFLAFSTANFLCAY